MKNIKCKSEDPLRLRNLSPEIENRVGDCSIVNRVAEWGRYT